MNGVKAFLLSLLPDKPVKALLFVTGGALLGFGYYYFIGCRTGSCPITGSPYISTIYGAFIGLLWAIPSKKKEEKNSNNDNKG